jgi:hypothetical protein
LAKDLCETIGKRGKLTKIALLLDREQINNKKQGFFLNIRGATG